MNKKVISVLGPISPENMGVTDAHNHLWISPQEIQIADAPVLNQEQLIIEELLAYKTAGGNSQIDCQPGGAGRDGNQLRKLSKASGVNVVACTGFHLSGYYPAGSEIWNQSEGQAADYFLSEIRDGLEETRKNKQIVYPGFIKIAVRETPEKSPIKMIKAAVTASIESGYAIEMHTEKGEGVEYFLEVFMSMDYPLNRLVICHIDKRPDLELHKELAEAGCMLEYDTFFRPKYHPERHLWNLISVMVGAGFQKSIALATDLADQGLWKSMGKGPGLVGFIEQINNRLELEGFDQPIIENLMGGNIAERLSLNYQE